MIKPLKEVERFIIDLRNKMRFYDIVFLDRDKNRETIRILGIRVGERKEIVSTIEKKDYVETFEDSLDFPRQALWVFGKAIQGKEVYIKITLGRPNSNVICISFHIAERPLIYPYK
ncbi:MAG: type II toxin-antitoxin system MqsR family toxin [Bacteroidales bacterium]|nr:type II toxin-antitoxin system MqsR family toxin [Bacteroidales bacterium]